VTLDDEATFMGNLYAPNAEVRVVSAPLEVFGSVFAGRFDATADVAIHYDRGILRAGESCEDDPGDDSCDGCGDCRSSEACVGGTCGPCTSDADCCEPLVCDEETGECRALLL
ncbi:MAG: DUF7305 domain-containing protein, partial [Myxococcota bacterium]